MGLIDDLIQGVNREITKVQTRGQEMMQTYQLNSQIRHLEGKKTATLIEIGRMIYEKYQRSADVSEEQIVGKTKEIVDYEHEITSLQAELEQVKAQFDPNRTASQRAEAKAGYTPTPGFTCPHCQAPAASDKQFCPACGGSLRGENGGKPSGDGGEA